MDAAITHTPVTLHLAQKSDLDAIESLERGCFPDPWRRVSLQAVLQSGVALIARSEPTDDETPSGSVVGYALASLVSDEAELLRLAVAPAQRRQKVGRALLESLFGALSARGVATVFLEVRATNTAARRLYQSAGFEEVGRRPRYYSDGEDAYIYRRALGSQSTVC